MIYDMYQLKDDPLMMVIECSNAVIEHYGDKEVLLCLD